MKLSFQKEDLQTAIQSVQSSVPNKSTLPILSNILLKVEKGEKQGGHKVWLEATDLEVGIRSSVKAEVVDPGRITIPGKRFGDLVREMPDANVEISTSDGKKVELKCGKVRATLVSLPPEGFPVIPEFPQGKHLELDKAVFREMLKKTAFAVSTDQTRYVLNGIYFGIGGGELKTVATDGRRLAFVSRPGGGEALSANVIIPSKAINELLRLLGQDENGKGGTIQIAPFENQISFKWSHGSEDIVLISRVIDGTFPNYDQVIPKTKEIELQVKTQDIFSAIKRAALFAQDRGGSVRFSLAKSSLRISANAQGIGEEEEELEVEYKGPDFEIAFNPQFLLDSLKNNDSPEIRFEFSTSLNPGLIKPSDSDRYLCVIMPMRLQ